MERRYFDPIETAPRQEIERRQLQRLIEQVQHVYARSPLVRREWDRVGLKPGAIRSVADFTERAPFTDKAAIQRYRAETGDPMGGVLAGDISEVALYGTSSGTTGDPTLFAESWTARGEMIFTPRDLWETGLRPGDYLIDVQMVIRSIGRLFFQDLGATPIFFHHDASDVARMIDACLKYRPTWMFHISSPIIYALERMEAETNVDLRDAFSSFRGVIYGGEPMGFHNRGLMERWGVPVFEFTSLGDCGTAWECQARDGFHAWEDLVLFEVIDPASGAPVPPGGRGEMVCTALVDKVDPLIRFRSGDLVRWTNERCACGRTHARYWPLGRAGDETVVNGRSVMPTDIWAAIESVPETASGLFQIIRPQREVAQLKLRVGYDGDCNLNDLAGRVALSVEKTTGLKPAVELMKNAEIVKFGPPHKNSTDGPAMNAAPHYGLIGGAPGDASAETLALLEGYNRGHRKNPAVPGASDIWAVGCAETADGLIDYPLSWTDIANDEAWADEMLALAGVGAGDFAFFSYIYSRSAHAWPWMKRGLAHGAKLATGMPTQWDAYRLEMYCRLFRVKFIFGLTTDALDGLEGAGHTLKAVFGKVDRILAVGAAASRLRAAGLAPWKLHWLGPIIAVDACDDGGARFDHKQWTLEAGGGGLLISNRRAREARFDRAPLRATGRVEIMEGEPRLFLEEPCG